MMLPRKNSLLNSRLKVPPTVTINVPVAAVVIPKICFLLRFSLKILVEKRVMMIGERRQTKMEAMDAPASLMPVY